MIDVKIGDCRRVLKTLPDKSVHCCVTSPPYYGLRDYGVDGQIGLEKTPDEYVNELVNVFREVRRVLRDDGTLWLNLGDSYASNNKAGSKLCRNPEFNKNRPSREQTKIPKKEIPNGLKPKDLIGIPWRVAFALQADGWYLRSDIIWCISGGTWLYVKSQKGVMPMTIKDLYRLDPKTVQLWNGKKWTNLLGMSKSERRSDELELVLRSGERISCTPNHKFPSDRGLLEAFELKNGDVLKSCTLPDTKEPLDCAIGELAGWFAGLYIAEGSKSGDTIQIAGHSKESERWDKIQNFVKMYGGHTTRTIDGNKMDIRVYGKVPNAIINELVSGKTAKDKGFAPVVWNYSNKFLDAMLQGYLDGDGHNDAGNNRWRLGFTRNYNLERDLRTVCARLGYKLTLNMANVKYNGSTRPTFRGEIRKDRKGHWNEKNCNEIVEIRKSRCRYVYDIGVEDDPHLFSLSSGILTHNSKPNPMPESVQDRPTKAHEYVFLLSKSERYFYDNEAVKEQAAYDGRKDTVMKGSSKYFEAAVPGQQANSLATQGQERWPSKLEDGTPARNRRSVWNIPTKPYLGAHFATFPLALVEPCLKAGCPVGGTALDPFGGSGTVGEWCRHNGRNAILIELNNEYEPLIKDRCMINIPELSNWR